MSNESRLNDLIGEYKQLDAKANPQRAKEILREAAPLVDRQAAAKKWAALRSLYADLSANDDVASAAEGYRDALTVWCPEEERGNWAYCNAQLGVLLAQTSLPGAAEAEEAIDHLEKGVAEQPWIAPVLAKCYGLRPGGDCLENWCKRIKYLELASSQSLREENPLAWVNIENELARAEAEEPNADFSVGVEKRILRHEAVLAALAEGKPPWVATCLDLADAYLCRVQGDQADNGTRAERLLRDVLNAPARSPEQEITALLLLGRCLIFKPAKDLTAARETRLREGLALLQRVTDAARSGQNVALVASAEKFCALARLELLRLGDTDELAPLLGHCEAALARLDEATNLDERRIIFQIEVDAFFEVGDYEGARAPLESAAAAIEQQLRQQTTTAGKLERIWQFRDTTARLGYCCVKDGDLQAAIAAMERGRALLWSVDTEEAEAPLVDLIPQKGALLFPLFVAPEGVIIAVTRGAEGPRFAQLPLPKFGNSRTRELLSGADPGTLGGWLHAYSYRNSQPLNFANHIMQLGEILYRELWADIVQFFGALGVEKNAELVWFPQGGTAPLPIHAAWRKEGDAQRWLIEDYALRYAPSLKILARAAARPGKPRSALIVSDPMRNLANAVVESEWARLALTGDVISGDEACKAAILERLPSCTHLHYAGHAQFDIDDPLRSRLELAGKEEFCLTELAGSLTPYVDFVALSACETAVARATSLVDEALGFPTALLAHGARRALATLWSVDDSSSAFLIGDFYENFIARKMGAAQALRAAQNWLRLATAAELSRRVKALRDAEGPASGCAAQINSKLKAFDDAARPFEHPWYWAGFTIWGA